MPNIWEWSAETRKFTPDASSMVLFGPGVIEVTRANRAKAQQQIERECHGWQSIGVSQVVDPIANAWKPMDS